MTTMTTIEYAYRRFSKARFPLPSDASVAELEQRIGVTFPDDYRQFLLEFNGGFFTEPVIVPSTPDCPEDALTSMFGLGASHPSSELARERDLALFTENDPPQIIPIGSTIMGGLIILIVRPDGRGQIFLKKAFGDFYLLAHGIEEFFELLHEPPDE